MRGHSEKAAICELRRDSAPDTEAAGTLLLNFLASRSSDGVFCYTSLSWLIQTGILSPGWTSYHREIDLLLNLPDKRKQ